jgi:ribonucleoside-triphosphate reductase
MTVEKRDGRIVNFDDTKITKAVIKAAKAAKAEVAEDVLQKIKKYITSKVSKLDEPIKINDIHDAVEEALMKYNLFEVEKTYHDYRKERDKKRFIQFNVIKAMEAKYACSHNERQNANIDEFSAGGRIGEAQSTYSTEFALEYMMNEKFAKNHRSFEGYIHDADKYKVGMHNCLSIPFDDLLSNPVTIKAKNDIRPAGSIATGSQLFVVYFQTQSMVQFGGVAATHIDWTFVPLVKKSFFKYYKKHYERLTEEKLPKEFNNKMSIEDKLYKETNKQAYKWALEDTKAEAIQAMESMLHNLNTLQSRSGNQLPFTSICYGRCTLPEGRLITNALLDAWENGIGENHLTPIFPCGVFQIKKGVNDVPGTPNYDLKLKAIKLTPKRIYPNFSNGDWSVQVKAFEKSQDIKKKTLEKAKSENPEFFKKIASLPDEIQETLGFHIVNEEIVMNKHEQPFEYAAQMGCRTFNGFDINFDGIYFEDLLKKTIETKSLPLNYLYSAIQKDGRGNIIPITIVLPFLAMRAKKKAKDHPEYIVDYFIDMLEERISDAKDELLERFKWICAQPADAFKFMYQNNTMKGYIPEEGTISALKHGTFAIGQLGLAETLYILIGKDQTTPEGMELAKRIEQLYLDKCNAYKEHYKLNFGVYYTPAENLCFKSMKAFQRKYGLIENVSAIMGEDGELIKKNFFTNSMHVPVWEDISVFDKIDAESQLVPYSSAGSITYIEIDDNTQNNLKALEQFVDYAMAHDISYFAMNFKLNECTDCGSTDIDEETKTCRKCGSQRINWLRRITGYLNGNYLVSFNDGKQQEVAFRKQHSKFTNIKFVAA